MTLHPDPIHFVSALERAPGGDRSLARASHLPRSWPQVSASTDYDAYRNRAKALRVEALHNAGSALGRWIRAGVAAVRRVLSPGVAGNLNATPR